MNLGSKPNSEPYMEFRMRLSALVMVSGLSLSTLAFSSHALAQGVDPTAKSALDEAVAAMKGLESFSFKVKYGFNMGGSEAQPGMKLDQTSEMTVTVKRSDKGLSFKMDGRYADFTSSSLKPEDRAKKERVLASVWENHVASWADFTRETFFVRAAWDKDAKNAVFTPNTTWRAFFIDAEPFNWERRATTLTLEKSIDIDGEPCTVIKAVQGNTTRTIVIGSLDKLPRRYEQAMSSGQSRTWEFSDYKTDLTLTEKDFTLTAPEGFKKDEVKVPSKAELAAKEKAAEEAKRKEAEKESSNKEPGAGEGDKEGKGPKGKDKDGDGTTLKPETAPEKK
jgi:ketosteroid isomerase-like protein